MSASELSHGRIKYRRAVIAVKLEFIERSCDAEPAGHVGGFHTAYARNGNCDDIAAAHRTADQDDFQFDGGIHFQTLRAQEVHTGRTDVPRDERDRIFFSDAHDTSEAQGQAQGRPRIFALLVKYTDGVSRDSCKTANCESAGRTERNDFESRCAVRR